MPIACISVVTAKGMVYVCHELVMVNVALFVESRV